MPPFLRLDNSRLSVPDFYQFFDSLPLLLDDPVTINTETHKICGELEDEADSISNSHFRIVALFGFAMTVMRHQRKIRAWVFHTVVCNFT